MISSLTEDMTINTIWSHNKEIPILKISFIQFFLKKDTDGKLSFNKNLKTNQEQIKYGMFIAQTLINDIIFKFISKVPDGIIHKEIRIMTFGNNDSKLTIAEHCIAYKIEATIFKTVLMMIPQKTSCTQCARISFDMTVSSTLNILFQFNRIITISPIISIMPAIQSINPYVVEMRLLTCSISFFSIAIGSLFLNPWPNPKSNKVTQFNTESIVYQSPKEVLSLKKRIYMGSNISDTTNDAPLTRNAPNIFFMTCRLWSKILLILFSINFHTSIPIWIEISVTWLIPWSEDKVN